jgi:ParB family chromosome partitioning protein
MLKKINITDIKPFDKNPRINDAAVDRVLESLKANGYVSPIVVNEIDHPFKQHIIAAGHTRWKALEKFGSKEINVFVHKFESEKHFVRYNIEDNKTAEFAQWDEQELANLSMDFDIDLTEMGFDFDDDSEKEIEDLSETLEEKYEIAVECENESEQEMIYQQLIDMKLTCRILTL